MNSDKKQAPAAEAPAEPQKRKRPEMHGVLAAAHRIERYLKGLDAEEADRALACVMLLHPRFQVALAGEERLTVARPQP